MALPPMRFRYAALVEMEAGPMGWVSCLEDMTERFDEWLSTVAGELELATPNAIPLERMRQMLADARSMLREVHGLLDLATDPTIDLAAKLADTERRAQQAETLLSYAKGTQAKEARAFHERIQSLESQILQLKQDKKMLVKQNRRTEAKLAEMMRRNPTAVYDAYSNDEQIRHLKPGEGGKKS